MSTEDSILTLCLLNSAHGVPRIWIPCLFPFAYKHWTKATLSLPWNLFYQEFSKESHKSCLYQLFCQLVVTLGLLYKYFHSVPSKLKSPQCCHFHWVPKSPSKIQGQWMECIDEKRLLKRFNNEMLLFQLKLHLHTLLKIFWVKKNCIIGPINYIHCLDIKHSKQYIGIDSRHFGHL